jgi:hypothetical protein
LLKDGPVFSLTELDKLTKEYPIIFPPEQPLLPEKVHYRKKEEGAGCFPLNFE